MIDVKRILNPAGSQATLLSTNNLRCTIDDWGSMVSSFTYLGYDDSLNLNTPFHFKGYDKSIEDETNPSFWKFSQLLYKLGGSYFSFPNYGESCQHEDMYYSKNSPIKYRVVRYGTDPATRGVWCLSKSVTDNLEDFEIRKIDLIIPDHSVLYTAITFENKSDKVKSATLGSTTYITAPMLETNSMVLSNSTSYSTHLPNSSYEDTSRLAPNTKFSDLRKAPLKDGGHVDLSVIKQNTGFCEGVIGKVNPNSRVGWSAVVNPNRKMVAVNYFLGEKGILDSEDLILQFHNFEFNSGGMKTTPYALYDGGEDMTNYVTLGASIGHGSLGLASAIENPSFLKNDTSVVIEPNSFKRVCYAQALAPYENARIGQGFYSIEPVIEGLVLKRTKSWALIECDSTFHYLKTLEKRLRS